MGPLLGNELGVVVGDALGVLLGDSAGNPEGSLLGELVRVKLGLAVGVPAGGAEELSEMVSFISALSSTVHTLRRKIKPLRTLTNGNPTLS